MALKLRSFEFRREREKTWRELERLVDTVEKNGVRGLGAKQLARLPQLYRAALSGLSVARAISLDKNLVDYLESLCARAYFCVYGTKQRLRDSLAGFFGRRFPAAVRRFRVHLLVAFAIFAGGMLTGWALTARSMDWYYSFIDAGMAGGRDPAATTSYLKSTLYADDNAADTLSHFSAFLFQHNARVGMFAFALGFLAGLPVFLLLFWNGATLGAMSALFHDRGLGVDWWSWILPHGVPELFAIWVCGAAGLVLAEALVFPGRSTRLANLARRGREAGILVLGAVALLAAAALIEGVFRQTVHHLGVRYAVATTGALLLAWYLVRAGRRPA